MRRKPLAPLTPEQQQLAADNERLIYLAIHATRRTRTPMSCMARCRGLAPSRKYIRSNARKVFHTRYVVHSQRDRAPQEVRAAAQASGMLILYTDDMTQRLTAP